LWYLEYFLLKTLKSAEKRSFSAIRMGGRVGVLKACDA